MPPGRLLSALAFVCAVHPVACHREATEKKKAANPELHRQVEEARRKVAEVEARERGRAEAKHEAATNKGGGNAPLAEPPSASAPAPGPSAAASPLPAASVFRTDEPIEVAAPGSATATPFGVIMNSKDGNLYVAHLGRLPPVPAKTPLTPLPSSAGPFGLGRGPSFFQEAGYWISHGSLVRRKLPAKGSMGPLEILARDAFDGTRVAAPLAPPGQKLAKIPATVAYIVRPPKEDSPLIAKLWVEGQPSESLTAEGNSTHSVSLVHTEEGVLAVSVQARMAMTPVHARHIGLSGGRTVVGEDVVVWVGGAIQPLTEMTLLPSGGARLYGFLPHERSISEFGIARLDVGMNPSMDTATTWLLFPNGIDPAPVAAGHLCGEPVILYAAPETAAPESPQELVLRSIADPTAKRMQRLSSARAFYFVSISAIDGGALAVWVTEEGTFACTVRCTSRRN